MLTVGLDVGSTYTKGVIFNGNIEAYTIIPTGWIPKEAGKKVLDDLLEKTNNTIDEIDYIVGTGYGRVSLPFIDKAITEITCHARGIHHIVGTSGSIIDIGGQDTKVIVINDCGKVVDFVMNDKCAAGTGRFFEVMARALGMDVNDFGSLPEEAEPVQINSMCAVFAESEIISLLAQGIKKDSIIAGLHCSVARRVKSMLKNNAPETVIFTGGGAKNKTLSRIISKELGVEVIVPEEPQITGALGAAIIAHEKVSK